MNSAVAHSRSVSDKMAVGSKGRTKSDNNSTKTFERRIKKLEQDVGMSMTNTHKKNLGARRLFTFRIQPERFI